MKDDMKGEEILTGYKEGRLSTTKLLNKLQNLKQESADRMPLSEGQKGLWMIEKVSPESGIYNIPICLRIHKAVDVKLLKQAFYYIVDQYPILKTVIREEHGIPYQSIQESQPLSFQTEDITEIKPEKILAYIKNIAGLPFSLSQGPLMRIHLFSRREEEQILLINIHHIIFDGISIELLIQPLFHAYLKLVRGKKVDYKELSSNYNDFVKWESEMLESKRGELHRRYWKKQLSGSLPVLELPADYNRSMASVGEGATHRMRLHTGQTAQIRSFCKSQHISMATFFLGILQIVLYQYSNQEDIIVGMASKGRPSEQFESLIGFFINMIPIRSQIKAEQYFNEFLKELQLTMLDGMDHADYPFTAIVSALELPRDVRNSPVFQVGYFYQNFIDANALAKRNHHSDEFSVDFIEEIHQEGEYELTLEIFEQGEDLLINVKYNPNLYRVSTIQRMYQSLIRLAEEGIRTPKRCLREYPMLSVAEEKMVLNEWNATQKEYMHDRCVHELFEEQAQRTPEATAVIYENESLTYRELDEKSTELAIYLQTRGVGPDSFVGICVERSLFMIVGLMGILKAGGAYVPFDPDYPAQRLQYMADDSKVSIVVTQDFLINKISTFVKEHVKIVSLETGWKQIRNKGEINQGVLQRKVKPEHLAYVLYTSGSTGNPKGVMISHKALANFLHSMGGEPGLAAADRLLAVTTYCFDIAGLELYLPLIKGAKCFICSSEKQKNIEKLRQEIKRIRPTIMQATPATWTALFRIGWENEEGVKVLCGGEAFPESLRQSFMNTHTEVWNMFGPTETTVWSTIKRIGKEALITIGKPIANTQIYILNKYMQPVVIHVPGELYIGGAGLARGYLNMPELTQERFVDNPFDRGTKLYKTGDLARWLDSGEVEFLGRMDNQVKLHGFRIEPGEIETKLTMHPQIQESAVIIRENNKTKQLKAFYVCKEKSRGKIDPKELRIFLKKTLPSHMIPSVFTELETIPLTPNGKVNRLELAKLKEINQNNKKDEILQTNLEKIVLETWKDVIGIDEIGEEEGFFEIGGNSITAVVAAERLSERLDCDIQVTAIFEYTNVKELSGYISELQKEYNLEETDHMGGQDNSKKADDSTYPAYYEESVAIIGISCQFPGADNHNEFWNNLIEGKESVRFLTQEELNKLHIPEKILRNPAYVPVQATIQGKEQFDAEFFKISPKDAAFMDPQMRLLLMHSWKAVEDAGYQAREIPNTAVYMSSSNNVYQASNAAKKVRIIEQSDEYVTWLLNQGGTIPTMISYQLGLRGPSYSVHSNCSSSLVGLQSAYKSLLSGEAEYALVGASTIHSLLNAGYVHLPGLNFSGDGHIKAFDSAADGMIGGEGVGVILLKSARRAMEDGDNIYSVLRGIHINNDGAEKVGFYAPSIKGQTEVIQKVLESTKINPETIDYIEAHGTGTKLGDPIEVRALQKAYQKYTDKKQFCGIGSVKTNIGHLDTVAGLAGCIKVALSLYHNHLPKTINYKKSNPEIDFDDSPFYVVEKSMELADQQQPHRAALSSFGIGGTNVHAIFESYKRVDERNTAIESKYLIPLSARNEERLKDYAALLLEYLKSHKKQHMDLGDIAYTLQVGRTMMEKRVIFLVQDIKDLIHKMEQYSEGKEIIENCFAKNGKQDKASDELIEQYIAERKWEKLAILWASGIKLDWALLYVEGEQRKRISLPTYPFAKEVYWRNESDDRIRESTEEQKVTDKLHPFIDRNTSDFVEQKYTTRFTGEEFFLVDHIINQKKVLPGVAYIELARAAGEITTKEKVRKIKNIVWTSPIIVESPCEVDIILKPKERIIEYRVCTADGKKKVIHSQGKLETMQGEAKYLAQQERIDIKSCIENCYGYISHSEFYESDASSVYQYGETFRPIKEIHFNEAEAVSKIELPAAREDDFTQFVLHPSLLEGCLQTVVGLMKGKVSAFMPFSIEELEIMDLFPKECYVHAVRADHPSDKDGAEKFNIQLVDMRGRKLAAIKNYSIRTIKKTSNIGYEQEKELKTVYYYNTWKRADIPKANESSSDTTIIFDDMQEVKTAFKAGRQFVYVTRGHEYKSYDGNNYELHPARQEDYQTLFADLKEKHMVPGRIVHMQAAHLEHGDVEEQIESGIHAIFNFIKAILEVFPNEKIIILFVYKEEAGVLLPLHQAVSGFIKTVQLENPKLICKTIQIPLKTEAQKELLLSEFEAEEPGEICYTKEGRFISTLQEDTEVYADNQAIPFRNGGVFLITGGLGGIGFILARYLAKQYKARLVLAGRTNPDDGKRHMIKELEALGGQVLYIKADVSKRGQVQDLIKQILKRFKKLHGVIHCAGMIQDKLIKNKKYEDMKSVMLPKVQGTIFLDEALRKVELDFFVFFSSVSYLGNIGQADYAYANNFLNKYAEYCENLAKKNQRFGRTISISWPFWEDGGMRLDDETMRYLTSKKGIYPFTAKAGIRALEKALMKNQSHLIAYYGDQTKIRQNFAFGEMSLKSGQKKERPVKMSTDDNTLFEYVEQFLIDTASSLLKIQNIDIDRDMIEYGFDSISNTEFANKINAYYHIDVMPTIFFELELPTIRALAAALCKKYNESLRTYYRREVPIQAEDEESSESSDFHQDFSTGYMEGKEEEKVVSRFSYAEDINVPVFSAAGEEDEVAIIGMNGIFPQSENLEEFWENLIKENNLITEIPPERFDWKAFDDPRVKWGGFMKEVDKFDADFFGISALEAEVMDPQHRLFLQVAWGTLEDAGYKPSGLSGTDTGIFVGIGTQDYSQLIDKYMTKNNPYALTGRTPFMLVNRISSMLNLKGPSEPVDTACSSSLVAVHKAAEAIRSGICNMAIAGGVNVILNPTVHLAFSAAGMLTDSGKCKVFDKEADGTIRSEGVGAILLKKKSKAIQDGDHIYALIKASAERHKGKSNSLTAPSANAEADLLVEVYKKANIDPSTVSYIEAHSTGTKIGDPIEINGLKIAFQKLYEENGISEVRPHCAIGSLKTNIGHLEAAAGIGAFIKVLLAMKHEKMLRTLHFNELNPYISLVNSPFYISQELKPWKRLGNNIPRRAGVSAFGFGGVNTHVVLEEYIQEQREEVFLPVTKENPAVIVLSAKSEERLKEQVKLLWNAVNKNEFMEQDLASIAYTLQTGREALTERLAFAVSSIEELEEVLAGYLQNNRQTSNVYNGQVNYNQDVAVLLQKDEGFMDVMEMWIKNGEYHMLLSLWVKGFFIDWNRFYKKGKPKRISLPTYPFQKTRHWLPVQKDESAILVKEDNSQADAAKEESTDSVKTELVVLNLLSGLLGVDVSSLDRKRPVLELGVDSIILTQLLQQLQKINESVDFETLYHCKTINEIIGLTSLQEGQLEEKANDDEMVTAEYPELIRLNKANQNRPVFWFHGGFGGVEVYRFIAQIIQRPFYGIQAKGYMTDHEPIQGIEAMASYYIDMIRSIQPQGPYDLGGLSLGGMIAYEVARQMQELGLEVASILMLESIYVDEEMQADWAAIPISNLKKDRMFRAANLLLSFSSNEKFMLISERELDVEQSDEEFLEQLIVLAWEKGSTKAANQLRMSIVQLEKILGVLDMSTTFYTALPLSKPDSVPCYYFCNTKGSLFGEQESYFRLIDKGRKYNYRDFSARWREKLPKLRVLNVEAESHLTLLTEPASQKVISEFCIRLYSDEERIDEYIKTISNE